MAKTHYVCEGTCHADISEERFKGGLTVCGAKGCTREGKSFTKLTDADGPHTHG